MATTASRTLTALVLIAGLLAVAMAVRPDWLTGQRAAASGGGTVLIYPPDERTSLLGKRLQLKGLVVRQLLAGELTLLDAAAAFRLLNDRPANMKDESWRKLPGNSDGERLSRQVISWVEPYLRPRMDAGEIQARVARLEEELAEHLARHGTVDLGPGD